MVRASLVLAVLAAGCYSPSYKDCAISCASNACPSDLACIAGMCRTNGETTACAALGSDAGIDEAAPEDAAADAPYPTGMWGSASVVDLGTGPAADPSLTPDMLEMYFTRSGTIYMTARTSTTAQWNAPVQVAFTMASVNDQTPDIQADDVTLLFSSNRSGGSGGYDLYVSTRPNKTAAWKTPTLIPAINSAQDESDPFVTSTGLTLLFSSTRADVTNDIFIATRATATDDWGGVAEISELDTQQYASAHPNLSPDGLTIYFQSTAAGSIDLYTAHRTSPTAMFDTPQPIAELNTNLSDGDPWVSADGHHIFFSSSRINGVNQVFEASR